MSGSVREVGETTGDLLIRKTALISPCGKYRYRLERIWGNEPLLPFVMLNPSTADAEVDDPTIRRCMRFARREGSGGIVVVNLYAFRAADPRRLALQPDPYGPDNFRHIDNVANSSGAIVCAWGSFPADGAYTAHRLGRLPARLVCLGKTKDGSPRHPLYVRADQPLEPFL